jgi:hypothetical protein
MKHLTYCVRIVHNEIYIYIYIYNIRIYRTECNMITICRSNNMCNVKASTNVSSVKSIILVWDILELTSFLHHDCKVFASKAGPNKYVRM